jgi:membrane protein DedA with SNARE-associated domain
MLFAGFNVSEGETTLLAVTAAGVLGNVLGSWMAWAAGYYGRTELLERSRFIHINPKHLAAADRWFERHGDATVFWTRMLPIIRTFISLPAGVARMPFWRFTLLTLAGCIPWVLALALIGKSVGDNWTDWQGKLHYFDYFVAALIVIGLIYLLIRWRRGSGGGGEPGTDSGPAASGRGASPDGAA